MSTPAVHPIPAGAHSLTPHLTCAGAADAIAFYRRAFGGEELSRVGLPNGRIAHACVRIGDSMLFLNDEVPEWRAFGPKSTNGTPVTIHLYVEDVDATVTQAVEAGARVLMPVADQFWGDRYGLLEDPFGHRWSVATHVRDVSPDEIRQAMASQPPCPEA